MRSTALLIALTIAFPAWSHADSSGVAKREAALKGIDACFRRNEASSRECKSLNKNVETLEDLYRQGDETVLPTLFRFTYLTDFFGESLIAHPDTFLGVMSHLTQPAQQAVAIGMAGRMSGLSHPRFDAIRSTLTKIPNSSPVYQLARNCLRTLEAYNAMFLVDYFPPQAFTPDPRNILIRWYSNELYSLGEKPLSDYAANTNAEVYRLTILPTWGNAITFRIERKGDLYSLSARRVDGEAGYDPGKLIETKGVVLNPDDSKALEALIQKLGFFKLPTDDQVRGFDGDESVMEGVLNGEYHVIDRWTASYNTQKRGLTTFVSLAKFLVRKSTLSHGPTNKGHKIF
jgi:hypothetical protein